MSLLPHHAKMLTDSGISPERAAERGSYSIETKAAAKALGFTEAQQIVPALAIPTYTVLGEKGPVRLRPDNPRRNQEGKIIKYEMPKGAKMLLDVPQPVQPMLADPRIPLFITEGEKKADSAVSIGLCCIALLGVTCYRGTNAFGGKTLLSDFQQIAWNDREVYLAFDSDFVQNRNVYGALQDLKAILERRKANVKFVCLPPGENGTKVGLDDFLVAGNRQVDLLLLARDTVPLLSFEDEDDNLPWRETPASILWRKPTRDGFVDTPLTNFVARIVAEEMVDDGAETRRYYQIKAQRGARSACLSVSADAFDALTWTAQLGAATVIYPGNGIRDQVAVAIRQLSGEPDEVRVYTHTGWREIEAGRWVYLHAGGAIGAKEGDNISSRLSGALAHYELPEPPTGKDLSTAVHAALRLLDVGPDALTFPLLATVFRAALGTADYTLALTGRTGTFKSEVTSLAQRFYGKNMDRGHLPGNWNSTDNALQELAFYLKDTLFCIDDFIPLPNDFTRLHAKADRVLRAQGNGSPRQRMKRDGGLRPDHPPRGLIVSTGEDIPRGHSLQARLFLLEVQPGDISPEKLTLCQNDAENGVYAACMAGFLAWMAPRYSEMRQTMPGRIQEIREKASKNVQHLRTPETVANLVFGFERFLEFAQEVGAMTAEDVRPLLSRANNALMAAANSQAGHQEASDPVTRFLELIRSALSSGRAHLNSPDGVFPVDCGAWGWRKRSTAVAEEWLPEGLCIGWIDEDDNIYLERYAALQVAERQTGDGEGIGLSITTLGKRLNERKLLASTEGARQTNYIRKVLGGGVQQVFHIRASALNSGKSDISDISDILS